MRDNSQNADMDSVYQEYASLVYRFLYSHTHDPDWSEELMQETFLRAVSSISRYDGSCKLSTWLCQIAKHVLYQELRKKKRVETVELTDCLLDVSAPEGESRKTGSSCTGRSTICRKQSGKLFCTGSQENSPSARSAPS